ncbi:MAG: hypothetical protein GY938_24985 [Ketobacter sp.]|nr:hypothetical protein [Ketobacter sp.]
MPTDPNAVKAFKNCIIQPRNGKPLPRLAACHCLLRQYAAINPLQQ